MELLTSQQGSALEPNLQFPCSVCGKNFDNKKSQIRHLSYCRKRSKNPPRPRKRSCLSCTKSKCHCDSAFPACSKCVKRGLTCSYLHSKEDVDQLKETAPALAPSGVICLGPENGERELLSLGQGLYSSLGHIYEDLPSVLDDPFQFQALSNDGVGDTAERDFISPRLLQCGQHMYNELPLANHRQQAHYLDPRNFSLTIQPALRASRAFTPRAITYKKLSLNRKYVICTLKSYPLRLPQDKDPPPFVHPQYLLSNSQHKSGLQTSVLEPLATCSGIVAMWSVKNKNNSAFIWRSIRTEQERLFEQCHTYDEKTAIAALQAVCIYFILRVEEEDEDVTDFDIPLIRTMLKIARRFREVVFVQANSTVTYPLIWENWILTESLQRTLFTIFIIDFLFDISVGTSTNHDACDAPKHLLNMHLPCSKGLWRAKTREDWEGQYVNEMGNSGGQYARFVDLMAHDIDDGESLGETLLEKWMVGLDDFGMLVVSAASLADEVGFCQR